MAIFGKERLGIDLGTANTVISVANKGIALREPSLLAVEKQTQKVVAFGREASRMEAVSYTHLRAHETGQIISYAVF